MHEEIQQYLEKQLNSEEQLAFEKRLKEEPALLQALETELAARASIALTGRDQRRANLKSRYKRQQAPTRIINMRSGLLIAVAAAALFLIIWLPGQVGTNPASGPELYASYYEPQVLSGVRSLGEQNYVDWRVASEHFNAQHYPEAIPMLERLVTDSTFKEQAKAQFFLGMSYLESDNIPKAIEAFNRVPSGSAFIERAKWFTALAYVKQDDRDNARKLLDAISSQNNHFNKDKALELLKEL